MQGPPLQVRVVPTADMSESPLELFDHLVSAELE